MNAVHPVSVTPRTPVSEVGFKRPVQRALSAVGVERVQDFVKLTREDLRCRNIGEITLTQIERLMDAAGLQFSSTPIRQEARVIGPGVLDSDLVDDLRIWIGAPAVAALKRSGATTVADLRLIANSGKLPAIEGIGSAVRERLQALLKAKPVRVPFMPPSADPPFVAPPPAEPAAQPAECSAQEIKLTPREQDALRWTLAGKTAWEVGGILGISERTAVLHLNNAMHKLACTNKFQAAVHAQARGLI